MALPLCGLVDVFQVFVADGLGAVVHDDAAAFDENGPVAQALDGGNVVADEDQGMIRHEAPQKAHALLGKEGVAHGKGFVDDQHIRVHMGNDGKGQADDHAAGIALDGLIDEFADVGKGHDILITGRDFLGTEAKNGGIEPDVFPAGEFGIESAAQFQQGGHPSAGAHAARGGGKRAADDLQQGAFARAVATEDADALPPAHGKTDVPECPVRAIEAAPPAKDHLPEPVGRLGVDLEIFGDGIHLNGGRGVTAHRQSPFSSWQSSRNPTGISAGKLPAAQGKPCNPAACRRGRACGFLPQWGSAD